MNRELKILLIFVLLILTISQLLLFTGGDPSFEIEKIEKSDKGCSITYKVFSGSYDTNLSVVYFPVQEVIDDEIPIYLFYDEGYKTYEKYHTWQPYFMVVSGLYHDLQYEARRRGMSNDISLINSTEIRKVFEKNQKAVIIIPTVTWWVELSSPKIDRNILDSWVKQGGVLIWLSLHPAEFHEVSFYKESKPLNGVDNSENWYASDVYKIEPKQASVKISKARGGEKVIQIYHPNLYLIKKGFNGCFDPPYQLDLSDRGTFLSVKMMVNGASHLSLIFINLKDKNGNYRHYWIYPEDVKDNDWMNFSFFVNNPDRQSHNQINLKDVKICIEATKKDNAPPNASASLWIKEINLEKRSVPVTSRWPLIEATKESEVSEALNLQYGYVNLGASVEVLTSINGKVLGKIYEKDNEEKRTSIALIPFGKGKIVLFGYGIFPPYYQNFIAEDIMQIIYSGILCVSGPVHHEEYKLNRNSEKRGEIWLNKNNYSNWVVFTFSRERHSGFAGYKEIISLDGVDWK
jgi:hypothetical protein